MFLDDHAKQMVKLTWLKMKVIMDIIIFFSFQQLINYELGNTDDWYLDTRCSNHMTSHKE